MITKNPVIKPDHSVDKPPVRKPISPSNEERSAEKPPVRPPGK